MRRFAHIRREDGQALIEFVIVLPILLTLATRWLLLRLKIPISFPVLTYPSLTAIFTFTLWLIFFH